MDGTSVVPAAQDESTAGQFQVLIRCTNGSDVNFSTRVSDTFCLFRLSGKAMIDRFPFPRP